jgi:hypothetical protein
MGFSFGGWERMMNRLVRGLLPDLGVILGDAQRTCLDGPTLEEALHHLARLGCVDTCGRCFTESRGEATMTRGLRSMVSRRVLIGLTLCVALVALSFPVPPAQGQTASFDDVDPSAFYAADVAWLVAQGITTGTGPRQFGPNVPVTRGQAVTFLFRYSDEPTGSPAHGFTDVGPADFYDKAVAWAFLFGITSGVDRSRFAAGNSLTRGQLVALLHRCAGVPAGSPAAGFADVSPAAFYAAAVAWAKAVGVTTGTSATTFSPDQTVTRGQIASFLKRLNDARGGAPCAGTPPELALQPMVVGTASPGTAEITILNASPEATRLSMGGPTPTVTVFDACPTCQKYSSTPPADACTRVGVVSQKLTIVPGRYRIAFEAVTGNASPLFGDWLLGDGFAYEFCVIITTT